MRQVYRVVGGRGHGLPDTKRRPSATGLRDGHNPTEAHDREQMAALAHSLPIEAVRKVLAGLAARKKSE